MSKRTQSIRSMFSAKEDEAPTVDNKAPLHRMTAGAVKSLKDTFSGVERDYQELRNKLASGAVAIDLDPQLIDPSPFADRFAEQDEASFEMLKQSLADRGQEIPILVREHPTVAGRYQSAYGHRRVRALRELGRSVRAYIRPLSDEDLVVAQGIENSAREDLSFIERASFAYKLEAAGFQRTVVQTALSIDRAEASKLVAVAKAVPAEIVDAIGRAPKIGRARWQALSDLIQDVNGLDRATDEIKSEGFAEKPTDERFMLVLTAATNPADRIAPAGEPLIAKTDDGREIAKMTRSARHCRIQLDRNDDSAFADYVMSKLPALYEVYQNERSDDK